MHEMEGEKEQDWKGFHSEHLQTQNTNNFLAYPKQDNKNVNLNNKASFEDNRFSNISHTSV